MGFPQTSVLFLPLFFVLLCGNISVAFAENRQSGEAMPAVAKAQSQPKLIWQADSPNRPDYKQPQAAFNENKNSDQVVFVQINAAGLRLQANQVSAAQILKEIAAKTGIVIHYSALPDAPVSGICEGKLFSQVIECLIGARVNLAYRYADKPSTPVNTKSLVFAKSQPEEIWVLGAGRSHGDYSTMSCTFKGKGKDLKEESSNRPPDSHSALLQMAQLTGDEQLAELRKQAMSLLAAKGKTGDAELDAETTKALQAALTDQDADIRAQALFGLSQQDCPDTSQALHDAMRDKSPDVRLMAVDSTQADNPDGQILLQQALNDSDETVKAAASYKLGIEYVEPGQ